MTRNCVLCGKTSAPVSYHTFPKHVKIREEWNKFCLFIEEHIEETLHSSSTHYLCSSHFVAEDYLHPVGGLRNKLRKDAIPSVYCSTTEKRDHTQIKEGAVNDHYTSKQFKINHHTIALDHLTEISTSISSVATPDTPINEIDNVIAENSDEIPYITPPLHTYSLQDDVSSNDSAIFNFESNLIADKSTSAGPACKNPFFKEPCYIGDIKPYHLATPQRVKNAIAVAKMTITNQRFKIWNLKRTTRRLIKHITMLKGLVKRLKGKNEIRESAADDLLVQIPEPMHEILKREQGTRQINSLELRAFQLTLNFDSTKAYNYVRKSFNNFLPKTSTIRKWYSVIDDCPGFTAEGFSQSSVK